MQLVETCTEGPGHDSEVPADTCDVSRLSLRRGGNGVSLLNGLTLLNRSRTGSTSSRSDAGHNWCAAAAGCTVVHAAHTRGRAVNACRAVAD